MLLRLYGPFVRGDSSRSDAIDGHGLGLSIARSIAKRHGGTVELSNRSPIGLRASILLQLRACSDA